MKSKIDEAIDNGIYIALDNNELIIRGSKSALIELANYITSVASSPAAINHMHIDELTLVDESSDIKSLIIEKNRN